jgi:hypothetical protein
LVLGSCGVAASGVAAIYKNNVNTGGGS